VALTCCGSGGSENNAAPTSIAAPAAAVYAQLKCKNGAGRTGFYYLPEGYNTKPLPAMLLFHGTGFNGKYMVDLFKAQAAEHQFIIIAPDSNASTPEWQDYLDSPDTAHAEDCYKEIAGLPDVKIDQDNVIAAGWSAGGWFAVYYATNNSLCSSYAVIHGGVDLNSLGPNMVRGFYSSGTSDNICGPELVTEAEQEVKELGYPTKLQIFDDDHYDLSTHEKKTIVDWWL